MHEFVASCTNERAGRSDEILQPEQVVGTGKISISFGTGFHLMADFSGRAYQVQFLCSVFRANLSMEMLSRDAMIALCAFYQQNLVHYPDKGGYMRPLGVLTLGSARGIYNILFTRGEESKRKSCLQDELPAHGQQAQRNIALRAALAVATQSRHEVPACGCSSHDGQLINTPKLRVRYVRRHPPQLR